MTQQNAAYGRSARMFNQQARDRLAQLDIMIIGCGALGSRLAEGIARLGQPRRITLVDNDTVSESNLHTQSFFTSELNQPKVSVIEGRIRAINANIPVRALRQIWNAEIPPSNVVFLAVDSIETRRNIFNQLGTTYQALFDTRIGGWIGKVITVTPQNNGVRNYPNTLHEVNDPDAVGEGCQQDSFTGVSMTIAGIALTQFARWVAGGEPQPSFQLIYNMKVEKMLVNMDGGFTDQQQTGGQNQQRVSEGIQSVR